jgi:cytochrome b
MPRSAPQVAPAGIPSRVLVWDAPVRVLHAALAALVAFDYFVLDDGGPVHRWAGYGAAGVVCARWGWAAVARGRGAFDALRPSLRDTLAYLRAGAPRTEGHDPLGLWMVWLLWVLVLLLALTGWMSRLNVFWGDERVHDVHAALAHLLIAAVAVHLAGVCAMSWRWRENLPAAMVSGRKRPLQRPQKDKSPSRH